MRVVVVILLTIGLSLAVVGSCSAQATSLEERVNALERSRSDVSTGALSFLFGAFCALWAQNTRRSAWLWFFLGGIFSVITVIVLLYENSKDRRGAERPLPQAA